MANFSGNEFCQFIGKVPLFSKWREKNSILHSRLYKMFNREDSRCGLCNNGKEMYIKSVMHVQSWCFASTTKTKKWMCFVLFFLFVRSCRYCCRHSWLELGMPVIGRRMLVVTSLMLIIHAAAKPRWRQESNYTAVTALTQSLVKGEENYSKLAEMVT